ncbi:hypothetical protein DEJ50_31735 [Streptomyces venezuelae]|uniref:Uncharacterized protein n=1 Tax=Streptomyces venezuelae TaxID=54571 RepID=A0A5P2D9J3_STRVZ|nr:hypothetical protein [Streptomyces venezuelae]QES51746.1 hypothetical protein DEJ50_31735 [Streptomyces venezuelae]
MTLAAVLQLLLSATFFVIPVAVWYTGGRAQLSAEAEMRRQGHGPEVLARHGIAFREKTWELVFALGVGATLGVLGGLNLAGHDTGRLLSWIIEPLVLLVVGFITTGQVFAAAYTRAAFAKSEDPAVRAVDAPALIAAANSGFPSWLRPLVLARFGLATVGSALVLVLLAL